MAAFTLTSANVKPSAQARYLAPRLSGATIGAGQPCYQDANNVWQLSDANAAAPANRIDGIAPYSVVAGQPLTPVFYDPDFTHGLETVAAGDSVYLGATAGDLVPEGDLTTGWSISLAMIATSATKGFVNCLNTGAAHA